MPIETASPVSSIVGATQMPLGKRSHLRLAVEAEVALARNGIPGRITVRNKDLSWGGASLLVPEVDLGLDDSVMLKFPWRRTGSFSARAEVVWTHRVDEQHALVGVSFSKLVVSDEKKLQSLLSMLARSQQGDQHDLPLAESLEIRFFDRREMLAALGQIRSGEIDTTVFRSFQVNQRIRLILAGLRGVPTLNLRARVVWQKTINSEELSEGPGLFQVMFALEHPTNDLKRVADHLTKHLTAPGKRT